MARRFGGRFSPGASPAKDAAPVPAPLENRRVRHSSLRARLMYLLPLPLFFAALGAIRRSAPIEMVAEIGGFSLLMVGAWLLNEGLRAEAAFNARTIARPPAVPRKLLSAAASVVAITAISWLSLGQNPFGATLTGLVAGAVQLAAFGIDPLKKKGLEGLDEFETDRVARAIDRAEEVVRDTLNAARTLRDRRLQGRVEGLADQARDVFRIVENDPRDLGRARRFLSVYLIGLRDATVKFADLRRRGAESDEREKYEALLADMETSFTAHRTKLLEDNRSDLDVEIAVLRERLEQDGLLTTG